MSVFSTIALAAIAAPAALLGAAHLNTRKLARDAGIAVPPPGQFHDTAHGRIHYVEQGPEDAPPVVLIHGLAGQLQHFTYALADLLAQDFRVIALDRPGNGYSTRGSDTLARLPAQAQIIQEFLDAKGVVSPVLVGHSLGGAISLAMALAAPDKIRGLALLAPLTHPASADPAVFKGLIVQSERIRRFIAHTIAVPMAKYTADAVLQQVFAPEPCPEDFMDSAGGALGLRPESYVGASADASLLHPAIDEQAARYAKDLRTPGAILYGAEDALLDPAEHGSSMTRFGLTCRMEPGLGHMLPVTQPKLCEAFIRETIASLP